MGFKERIARGVQFEREVESYLRARGNYIARYGSEVVCPDLADMIRARQDPTCLHIRYMPDGVAFNSKHGAFYWDAKVGKTLERDAYNNYLNYSNAGARLILFVKSEEDDSVHWQHVNRVEFMDSQLIVDAYPEEKRFPVEDGWIMPRQGHGKVNGGSGTPYRYIDFSSMNACSNFYELEAA